MTLLRLKDCFYDTETGLTYRYHKIPKYRQAIGHYHKDDPGYIPVDGSNIGLIKDGETLELAVEETKQLTGENARLLLEWLEDEAKHAEQVYPSSPPPVREKVVGDWTDGIDRSKIPGWGLFVAFDEDTLPYVYSRQPRDGYAGWGGGNNMELIKCAPIVVTLDWRDSLRSIVRDGRGNVIGFEETE